MNEQETKELAEAISIIDQVCASHECNRANRNIIDGALNKIVNVINEKVLKKSEDSTDTQ